MKQSIAVITLGCAKNQVDSEVMCGLLEERYTLTDDPAAADMIVVNTCTFIEDAKQESIDSILAMAEYKTHGRCQKLIVSGCMAQRYRDELAREIPEIDVIAGINEVPDIVRVVESERGRSAPDAAREIAYIFDESLARKQLTPRHYAYVKIAEGCDHGCSFCVIPQVRGRYRSRTPESILRETERLVQNGVKEIILIAQDTTGYGLDLYGEQRLPGLIRQLAAISGLRWIRLLYCYPDLFSDALIEVMRSEPKVCRYVDLPLQHADERILQEMKRRSSAAQARALIEKLRQAIPEITLRTTLITGFPGEREEDFHTLEAFVREIAFDRLGVFAYSAEERTLAGQRPDQIPQEIREERRDRLMQIQQEIVARRQQRWIGQTIEVILEERLPDGRWLGRSQGDAPEIDGQVYVNIKSDGRKPGEAGQIVVVRVLEADSYDLVGEMVLITEENTCTMRRSY
ncbi:MAG: 30S ribosomal protein S12 methylthiotransferase RimO [Peptococcaceae bacterium]|nr:30S ribosomal protein S12 methylthiotransferase RimO [Peptococcaceae bacterium]